jgi:GT2 family glycosyltransferase
MDPIVTIVIPNWNGLEHLEECFSALHAQTEQRFRMIFVDNDSSDGSVAWVREHEPEVQVIQRPDNGGFAKMVNEGIRATATPYVILLNNDTLAEPDWLEKFVGALEADPCYDFAACLMMLYYEPGKVNAAGDIYRIFRLSGVNRGLGRPREQFAEKVRVLGACAGASLYRTAFFDDVGLFDEDFFLFHEDTDINLRALAAGKKCLYVPEAVVNHKHHGTIGERPSKRIQILEWRNKATTATKSLPPSTLALAIALFPLIWLRWTFPLRRQNWGLAPSRLLMTFEVWGAVISGARSGFTKRKAVRANRKISDREAAHWIANGTGPYQGCKSS